MRNEIIIQDLEGLDKAAGEFLGKIGDSRIIAFFAPMGAGKTYLMAAFIYLDLYFARNEPNNPAFAHNFMIFAPSGLKSSVVPSLKTIQRFDSTWVIPEPAASI